MGGDGFEHRLDNLNRQLELLEGCGREFRTVLVEQVLDETLEKYTDHGNLKIDVDVVKIVRNDRFNKPWLYNIGIGLSHGDDIVISEMDTVYLSKDDYDHLAKSINGTDRKWFFCWNKILYMDDENGSPERVDVPRRGMAEGGIIYIRRRTYIDIGGSNEWIIELGGIDNEFARRLEYHTGSYNTLNKTLVHRWHPRHRLKDNDWVESTYREDNRKIYNFVKRYPKESTSILKSYYDKMGNENGPICDRVPKSPFIAKK